jgi:TolA-binding protein
MRQSVGYFMKSVLFCVAVALASAASGAISAAKTGDSFATCRAAHAADAQARIACLEAAIARMQGRVQEAQQQAAEAQQEAAAAQQQAAIAQGDRPGWSVPGFRAAERAAEPEEVRVRIVRVRYGRDGHGFFTTADGQVWRETVPAPERRQLESGREYDAVIDRGIVGGFRMNVDGIRWEYKVEPLN